MGKSITPKYRIEIDYNDHRVWNCKEYGKPTEKNLIRYIELYIQSLKIGGCNEHISKMLGYMPIPNKAKIINQFTGDIVASWNAPMFMLIN
ncbi:MAG: hypothetical protein WC516_09780 [Patescibacteria group bacterium]|jgi:hypothetical protein